MSEDWGSKHVHVVTRRDYVIVYFFREGECLWYCDGFLVFHVFLVVLESRM